ARARRRGPWRWPGARPAPPASRPVAASRRSPGSRSRMRAPGARAALAGRAKRRRARAVDSSIVTGAWNGACANYPAGRCLDTCLVQLYDARLMLGSWSSIIDPIQLADKGARLEGELPVKGLSRLAGM